MGTRSASIIIRCFNEGKHIGRLLHGISEQSVKDVQLVIVDSGSTDETSDILSSYEHDLVHIPSEEFSFGRALNWGVEASTKPFFVAVSAHCHPVHSDWLERMLEPFADDKIALTYGGQRGPWGCHWSEQMIFRQWFPDDHPPEQEHPFCNNANAAVRRSVWEELPYDEELTGLEDLHWAKRAIAAGHEIRYVPKAVVIHTHEESSKQTYRRYFREALAMKRIYPDHHFSLWDFVRLYPSAVLHDYARAVREGVFLRNIIDVPRFRALQMAGAYRGAHYRSAVTRELRRKFYYPGNSSRDQADEDRPRIDYDGHH